MYIIIFFNLLHESDEIYCKKSVNTYGINIIIF